MAGVLESWIGNRKSLIRRCAMADWVFYCIGDGRGNHPCFRAGGSADRRIVDGADGAAFGAEGDDQVTDWEEGLIAHGCHRGLTRNRPTTPGSPLRISGRGLERSSG